MNPVRQLVDDLVEKRLWPVALLLAIAAIAIPVLIGGGSGDAASTAAPIVPAPGAVASVTPAVELVGPPAVRSRAGAVRDPFRRSKPKKAKSGSPASGATLVKSGSSTGASKSGGASGAAKSGGSSSGSGSGAGQPKVTRPLVPTGPAATLASRSAYETVARVVGPRADYEHPLDRLAVIGGEASPALQYLGVLAGGEYAIFLLGPDATAAGVDGACIVADPCRAIGLRRGEKLGVDVADGGGRTRHYEIEITSLREVRLASPARAQRQRERVAPGGRKVLRTLVEDGPTAAARRQLRYLPGVGTVALVVAP